MALLLIINFSLGFDITDYQTNKLQNVHAFKGEHVHVGMKHNSRDHAYVSPFSALHVHFTILDLFEYSHLCTYIKVLPIKFMHIVVRSFKLISPECTCRQTSVHMFVLNFLSILVSVLIHTRREKVPGKYLHVVERWALKIISHYIISSNLIPISMSSREI